MHYRHRIAWHLYLSVKHAAPRCVEWRVVSHLRDADSDDVGNPENITSHSCFPRSLISSLSVLSKFHVLWTRLDFIFIFPLLRGPRSGNFPRPLVF